MKKFLFLIFFFNSIILYAEEKKWYLYLMGGGGTTSTSEASGNATNAKFGFEYRPIPYIGFGAGLATNKMTLKAKEDPFLSLFPLLLLTSTGDDAAGLFTFFLLLDSLTKPTSVSIPYNTIGLDFNFHMNKDNSFDPYLGVGILGGNCAGGYSCTVTGGEAKLGVQFNLDSFFFFLQGQYQVLSFREQGSMNVNNLIGSLGLGARF